jgi:hypothetical protein
MEKERGSLQHQPFMTPIWLSVIGAFVAFCAVLFAVWVLGTADSTALVIVADPQLSAAPGQREDLLARMFGDRKGPGHLDAIYVSSDSRDRLAGAALAARLGIVPTVASFNDRKGLVRRALREQRGGRAMIIGNIHQVWEIVADFAGSNALPGTDDQEYGAVYIVMVPRIGHANLLRLNY